LGSERDVAAKSGGVPNKAYGERKTRSTEKKNQKTALESGGMAGDSNEEKK